MNTKFPNQELENAERPMWCNRCGSEAIEFLGYDDGGGDFGTAIEEIWKCNECGDRWGIVVHDDRWEG